MSQPSPDVKAVVRAAEALTTQVRRIADALSTPVVRYKVAADDGPTTPATTCSAQHRQFGDGRLCIRAAQHDGDHIDERGYHWSDTVAVYPLADSTVKIGHWLPASEQWAEERQELAGMVGAFVDAQVQHARADEEAEERCITHWHGACDGTTADCAFPTPGTGRRRKLRVLLNRLNNGLLLNPDEAQKLTQHVATEITERNTAHRRADVAERELHVLRSGLRANGADPTQLQNLWAQISLRNRQWRETKRELRLTRSMLEEEGGDVSVVDEMVDTVAKAENVAREAQAAIERVRALADQWDNALAPARSQYSGPVRTALDGTEQPTEGDDPEALRAKVDEATGTLRRVRTVVKAWSQRTLPRSEAHRLYVEVRDALAGPRPDPEPPTEA